MRALDRKAWRDLWVGRWTSLGLALLVAIVTILLAGGVRAAAIFEHTRDAWYGDLHLADLDVRCTPARPETLDGIEEVKGIQAFESRLVARGTLTCPDGVVLPALIQVLRGRMPTLNRLHILDGRAPRAAERAALVDRSLAASHSIGRGDPLRLRVGEHAIEVPVIGTVLSPEHVMLPVHPEYALPLRGTVALVAVTEAAVQHVPRIERFNSLQVSLDPGADAQAVAQALADALPIGVTDSVTRETQPGRQSTDMIFRTFGIYWPAIAGVMLLIASILLTLTLERLVTRQRSQLGLLRALGHRRRTLVRATLPLAVVPCAVGFGLGLLAHGAVARHLVRAYAGSVGLPPLRDPGIGRLWILGLPCIGLAMLITWLVCLHATRHTPATLLRPREAPRPNKAALLAHIERLPVSFMLGWTNVVRRRVASLASIAGLGAAFAMIAAFLLVHVTHRHEIEASVERLGLDATVQFEEPVGPDTVARLATAAGGSVEPLVTKQALVATTGTPVYRRIVCAQPGRWTAKQHVTEGRMFTRADAQEVVIDRWVADQQAISVGDQVWIHAYPNSPDALAARVVGIVQGVSLGLVVMPLETGRTLFGLDALATGAHVSSTQSPTQLEASLGEVPGVQAVFSLERARREVHRNFAGSTRVLSLALLLAIVVAIVFLGILAALDAADHAGDLAVLRALGWRDRTILGVCLTEVYGRGLLALTGGLLVAPWLARAIVARISEANHYRMAILHPTWLYGGVIVAVLILLPLGALPAWRVARRLTPGKALRLLTPQ